MGLRFRFTIPIVLLWSGIFAAFHFYWAPTILEQSKASYKKQQSQLIHIISSSISESVLQGNIAHIHSTLDDIIDGHQDWRSLIMHDSNGIRLYPLDDIQPEKHDHWITINHSHQLVGRTTHTFQLTIDPTHFLEKENALLDEIRWILFSVIFIAMVANIFLADTFLRKPISNISLAVKNISDGDYSSELPSPSKDEIGELIKSFEIMRYELKSHEDNLKQAYEKALESNRVKGEFISRMSHELRTPLVSVIGFCEIIDFEVKNENGSINLEYVDQIRKSGNHLLSIINDLLDFSTLENEKTGLNYQNFSLPEMIHEVIANTKPLSYKRKNTILTEISPNIDIITGDKTKLKQILYHLLSNAYKFTNNGHIDIKVRKHSDKADDLVEISVIDNGIGIPEEKQKTIFEAFSQVDNTINREYEGCGLGLSLCHQLCELMHGGISVKSAPDEGSTFTFWFPTTLQRLKQKS